MNGLCLTDGRMRYNQLEKEEEGKCLFIHIVWDPFGVTIKSDLGFKQKRTPPLIGWTRAGEGRAGELLGIKAIWADLGIILQAHGT